MYEGKRLLVTGGAGFLGSRLARALLPEAARIVVLDDLFIGRRSALPEARSLVFVQGSVVDGTLLRKLLAEVDYVFHFAARNMALSTEQPESDFRTNVEGTVQLVLGAVSFPQIRRIVVASTSSIYGNSPTLPTTEAGYDVSTPYAGSKMSAELLAMAYGRQYGIPLTCLRFSNVYGPGQTPTNPYCGVVSKFMACIRAGRPMCVFGDGTQSRDFTFVEDAIGAALTAGVHPGAAGGVFNVGTGVETPVGALAALVARAAGRPDHPVVHGPQRVIDTVHRRCIDASKLRRATGWRPEVSLEAGLRRTWAWLGTPEGVDGCG